MLHVAVSLFHGYWFMFFCFVEGKQLLKNFSDCGSIEDVICSSAVSPHGKAKQSNAMSSCETATQ